MPEGLAALPGGSSNTDRGEGNPAGVDGPEGWGTPSCSAMEPGRPGWCSWARGDEEADSLCWEGGSMMGTRGWGSTDPRASDDECSGES